MNLYWENILRESHLMRRKKNDLGALVKELFEKGMTRKQVALYLEIAEATVDRAFHGRKQ